MQKIRVLAFPCGSELGLELYRSLDKLKDIELIGGSSVSDHGRFVYKNYFDNFPFCDNENFIPYLKEFIREHDIDVVYPCMDSVICKCKEYEQELNCKVVSSCLETVEICLSKQRTYDYLKDSILVPKIFYKDYEYPLFLKPKIGYGSRNTFKVNNIEELNFYCNKISDLLCLEYLPGVEYTIDCFTNKDGKLLFVSPRLRNRIHNGISVNTKLIKDDDRFDKLANIINNKLSFSGAWFFQVKENKFGELCLLETASRFAGSSSIQRFLGVNLPYLSILNILNHNIKIFKNNFDIEVDRCLDIKCKIDLVFNYVYVDFDDTLWINEKLNYELVGLLYLFKSTGKKINLISKHNGNLFDVVERIGLKNLFDKIIHLNKCEKKSNFIFEQDAIFIDDSFSERLDIFENNKIPVFSLEAISCLR
jgi:hypothetical protein